MQPDDDTQAREPDSIGGAILSAECRAELDRLVAEAGAAHHCPSIAWGVTHGQQLIASGGYTATDATPPTERTVYRIASMTKSFSAAATLLLRDEGALSLDAPLTAYAPELAGVRFPTSDAPDITVRDLLCMTSGLVSDDPWADRHLDLTDDEFDDIVARPLVFAQATGNEFEYSNFGYALLGRVVHRATGTRLQAHVTDRLLNPLGMNATTWVQPHGSDWARPVQWIDGDGEEAGRWEDEIASPDDGLLAPMGGLWTTVDDLARWIGWLSDAFPARDGADTGPLRRASRREMQTPQRWVGMPTIRDVRVPSSYGYGLRILDDPERGIVITHSGGLPGYGSNMRWAPSTAASPGLGVIALANVTYAPMAQVTARLHDVVAEHETSQSPAAPVAAHHDDLARRLVGVLDRWARGAELADADGLFADNVGLDEPFERRAAALRRYGSLAIDQIRPLNAGHVDVECVTADGSHVVVGYVLAPHSHELVQDFDVTPVAAE